MKQALMILAALAVLVPGTLLAGEECSGSGEAVKVVKHKCEASTQECLDYMTTKFKDRGWVGIEMEIDEETSAMSVTKVEARSPAMEAGFKEGDVLVALNGVRLDDKSKEKVKGAQQKMTIGSTVTYTIERNGKMKDLDVTLGQIPEAVLAKWVGRHMLEGHTDPEQIAVAQKN